MARSKGIYARLREIGREFEKRWGYPVVILHCQHRGFISRIHEGFVRKSYQICILANMSPEEVEHVGEWVVKKTEPLAEEGTAAVGVVPVGTVQLLRLRQIYRNPIRAARLSEWVSMIWTTAVYGEKYHGRLKEFFGGEMIATMRREQRLYNLFYRRLKVILNPKERKDFAHLLEKAQLWHETGFRILIGLDNSGRPVAKAISWYFDCWGLDHQLFFLDPHTIVDGVRDGEFTLKDLTLVLKREQPELCKLIRDAECKVLLVDDQFSTKNSITAATMLIRQVRPDVTISAVFFSELNERSPAPSWHKRPELVGVMPAEYGSLTAELQETLQSQAFYSELKRIVAGIVKRELDQV